MSKLKTDFQQLKDTWYAKLKDSGFEDAEANEHSLKSWCTQFSRERSLKSYKAKAEYYYRAEHFLNSHKFASAFDRIVWEYHTNGLSIRDIVNTLKKTKNKKATRDIVWRTIGTLNEIMTLAYNKAYNESKYE